MAEQAVCRALGERPPSACRAATEHFRSAGARWPLGDRSLCARQTSCSAIARRALVGISGVVIYIYSVNYPFHPTGRDVVFYYFFLSNKPENLYSGSVDCGA